MSALTLAGVVAAHHACAQPYPNKPIRMIVPYPPGAGTDFTAREIGKAIGEALGQPVVMDHRPGVAAVLGHGMAAKAAPDGYTLGLGTTGLLATMPHVKTGRLRLLGIGHTQRIKLTPDIPAINETVPGY